MWVIRQGNEGALDRTVRPYCIYCTHFDALYRRKMLEDTWSKIAVVELPLMVFCRRCASEQVTSM